MPDLPDSLLGIFTPPLRPPVAPIMEPYLQQGIDRIPLPIDPSESLPGYSEGASVSVPGTDGTLKGVVAHSGGDPGGYPTELRTVDAGVTNKFDVDGIESSTTDFSLNFNATTGVLVLTRLSNGKTLTLSVASLADTIVLDSSGLKITNTASTNYTEITQAGIINVYNVPNGKSIAISPVDLANNITIDKDGIKVLNATSSNYAKISEAGIITVYDSSGAKTLTIDPEDVTQNMTITEWDVCDSGTPKNALFLSSAPY